MRTFQHSYYPIKSNDGIIVGVSCIVQDITERRRIEEAMRVAAEAASSVSGDDFFGTLVQRLTALLGVRFAFVSELCDRCESRLRLLGIARDNDLEENFEYDTKGKPCWNVIHEGTRYYRSGVADLFPDDAWLREEGIESYLAVPLYGTDGQPVGHLGVAHVDLLTEPQSIKSILRIVAGRAGAEVERKRAVKALRESEQLFRNAFEYTAVGMVIVDLDGRFSRVNAAFAEMMGYSQDELCHMTYQEVTHPDDVGKSRAGVQRLLAGELTDFTIEKRYRRKNGRMMWGLTSVSSVRDAAGRPTSLVAEIQDITRRKEAEVALRLGEKHLRMVMDNLPAFIAHIDSSQCYRFVNKRYADMVGLSPEQIVGRHVKEILGPSAYGLVRKHLESALSGQPVAFQTSLGLKSGDTIWLDVIYLPDFGEGEDVRGLYVLSTDITEQRKAEEQARRHQAKLAHITRLSMMGEMATSLSHELNQPLTAIVNYTNGCLRRVRKGNADEEEITDVMKYVSEQAQRAGEIIRRMRALARPGEPQRSMIDLNDIVRDAVRFSKTDPDLDSTTKIRMDLTKPLPAIYGDSVQLIQVILNLVRNALNAMADTQSTNDGITITSSVTVDQLVEVTVTDSGPGISPEHLERVFEPFYTTKQEGMGLGLPLCRSIIESHMGRIWADVGAQGGAIFRFRLPISTERNRTLESPSP